MGTVEKDEIIENLQNELKELKEVLGAIQENTKKPLFKNEKLANEFERYKEKYKDDDESLEIMLEVLKKEDR